MTTKEPTASEEYFSQIREPKRKGYPPITPDRISDNLRHLGIEVIDYVIDIENYRQYYNDAGYKEQFPDYYPDNLPEKTLEHYLSAKFLDLKEDDIYIDIASEHSPVFKIYRNLFGSTTYRQDIVYPLGIHGDQIGSDAANMPVPDGFATKMALHCSFEHFEGDSDIRFIQEAARVLKPGGVICIIPLYLADEYAVVTDPVVAIEEKTQFEINVTIYCHEGWKNRFGRVYNPEQLMERIVKNLNDMTVTVFRILNSRDVDKSCYLNFAALLKNSGY